MFSNYVASIVHTPSCQELYRLSRVKPQVAYHETLPLTISHGIEPAATRLLVATLSHHLISALYSLKYKR